MKSAAKTEKKFRALTEEDLEQVTGGKVGRELRGDSLCKNYDETSGECLDAEWNKAGAGFIG